MHSLGRFVCLVLFYSLLASECGAFVIDSDIFLGPLLLRKFNNFFSLWMYGIDFSERIICSSLVQSVFWRRNCLYSPSESDSSVNSDAQDICTDRSSFVAEEKTVHLKFNPVPYPQDVFGNYVQGIFILQSMDTDLMT